MHKQNVHKINEEPPNKKQKIESKNDKDVNVMNSKTQENKRATNNQIPSTTNICEPNIIQTNISHEIDPIQSTSKNYEKISNKEEPKNEFNFWQSINKPNLNFESSPLKSIKISKLEESKYPKITLTIRMTYKSDIRETKVGPVLSFHGLDETGEISFVTFGKHSNSQQISDLKVNKIYSIQNFTVYKEDPEYPSGTGNTLQIRIHSNTVIKETNEDVNIPQIPFDFIKIKDIEFLQKNDKIDVLGIVCQDYGLETNKKGSLFRDIVITDETKEQIYVTLWNTTAELFPGEKFMTVAIRKATVIEFNGKDKLNCLAGTLIWCNPDDIKEAEKLSNWFKKETEDLNHNNI